MKITTQNIKSRSLLKIMLIISTIPIFSTHTVKKSSHFILLYKKGLKVIIWHKKRKSQLCAISIASFSFPKGAKWTLKIFSLNERTLQSWKQLKQLPVVTKQKLLKLLFIIKNCDVLSFIKCFTRSSSYIWYFIHFISKQKKILAYSSESQSVPEDFTASFCGAVDWRPMNSSRGEKR